MLPHKYPSSTTLIEIVLYFTLVGILLFAAMTFSLQIFTMNRISSNFSELQSNEDFITQKIIQTIQTAKSLDEARCIFDNEQGALSLNMNNPLNSPTRFYLSNGNIFMEQGDAPAIQLNSQSVTVDTVRFHKVSAQKTPDQIIMDGEFSPKASTIANLNQHFPFHLSVSLRKW